METEALDRMSVSDAQSKRMLEDYDRAGFGYVEFDLVGRRGLALSAPTWVRQQIDQRGGLRLVTIKKREWRCPSPSHDVVVCDRVATA